MRKIFDNPTTRATLLFIAMGAMATAADAGAALAESGGIAKEMVSGVIIAFKWVLAFSPIWSAWFFASKMKEYLENKEEQGQHEPKAQKVFKIIAAVVIGIIAAYLLIGILAKVFIGLDFNEAWTKIVTDVWGTLTGLGQGGGGA